VTGDDAIEPAAAEAQKAPAQQQQTREAFSTALQQARNANEQLAAMQSQAAKLRAQAQQLMQQYKHQATGGVAARGKLSQTVAQLEKVLKAQPIYS
jgi:predicted transcriptional regulator